MVIKNNLLSDIYNLVLSIFILFICGLIYFKYYDKCLKHLD